MCDLTCAHHARVLPSRKPPSRKTSSSYREVAFFGSHAPLCKYACLGPIVLMACRFRLCLFIPHQLDSFTCNWLLHWTLTLIRFPPFLPSLPPPYILMGDTRQREERRKGAGGKVERDESVQVMWVYNRRNVGWVFSLCFFYDGFLPPDSTHSSEAAVDTRPSLGKYFFLLCGCKIL